MFLDLFKIILALTLFWFRGYVLIYLIDRSKSMSFGLKFFGGWLIGLAGFTMDLLAAVSFGGVVFSPVVFAGALVTQIFGFGFLIFIFERRILYPKIKNFLPFIVRQFAGLKMLNAAEKKLIIAAIALAALSLAVSQPFNLSSTSVDNQTIAAGLIYQADKIYVEHDAIGVLSQKHFIPLNDSLVKVWVATAVGRLDVDQAQAVGLFYYLLFLGFGYFLAARFFGRQPALWLLLALVSWPLIDSALQLSAADLLFSIFILMTLGSLYGYIKGKGKSFYYLAGIGLPMAMWTNNLGTMFLLPTMIMATITLLAMNKVALKDFLLQWFFAVLTVAPWLAFAVVNQISLINGYADYRAAGIIILLAPAGLLVLAGFIGKMNLYGKASS